MELIPHNQMEFKIVSALDEDMVLDCIMDNINPVILFKWHSGLNQRWKMIKTDNNTFTFINLYNSKVLSSPQYGSNNWEVCCKISKKKQQQFWSLIPCKLIQFNHKNAFFFMNSKGKVMDVTGGGAKNGQRISTYQKNKQKKDTLNQIWFIQPIHFQPDPKSNYKICSSQDQNLVLDACHATEQEAQIILHPFHKGFNQRFFIENYRGKYMLINKQHNFSLKVQNKGYSNQAKIIIGKVRYKDQQLWELIPCHLKEFKDKNAFYLRSHCGKYLDISNGQAQQDISLIQWDYNGDKNQIWFIHKI